ncbi:hypothetical protein EWM64_g10246 [Hericium alpestre]|uniref:Uncharacterized protein n=1 Tax=Hericium alpestre TaxID=135208 RepID=A0A4Y9ZGA2_9AGAM|nr:hypothetical protein EWM64_g10246 [Hericium alpestre]
MDISHIRVPRHENDSRAGVDEGEERSHSPALRREGDPMRNVGPDPDVDVKCTADGASGDGFFPLGDDYDSDERARRTYWVVLVGPIPGIYSNKRCP